MRDRFRINGHERGQVLVIFALALPVLIGMMGLGIDSAHIFQERRKIQSIADLAALAGASQLPEDPGSARSIAQSVAVENGAAPGEVSVATGYGGDDTKIEVTINREIDLFFMPVLGLDSVDISARAVAEHNVNLGASLFAKKDYHCWYRTIWWDASNVHVAGSVHSNGGLSVYGDDNTLDGKLTYKVGPPTYPRDSQQSCEPDVYMDGDNPLITPEEAPHRDYPVMYTPSEFLCTYPVPDGNLNQRGPWWVDGNPGTKQLNSGVICPTGSDTLTLNGSGVSGNVTFVATRIEINGTGFNLTPYLYDVLIFATGNAWPTERGGPAIDLTARGGVWEGLILNSGEGQIVLTGSSAFDLNGSIVGWAIRLRGNNWTISGNTEVAEPDPMRLVE